MSALTRIGGGGDAVVFRGEEPAMRRRVAVKVLRAPVADAEGRRAFERECELAGQIGQHPCAANIYNRGFDRDRPYIVMQYYERGSMAGRLRDGEVLTIPEVLSTGVRIASALQFAHNRGILHRDVKPENILCDAFGDPVLADFGIATHRDATPGDASTAALRHAMTPAYAAPEVVSQGGGWPVSDVWSLAATLYALLAGRPPYYQVGHPDARANLRAVGGPLPPITRGDMPPSLHQALARALTGEPDRRSASARRLAEELNAVEHDLGLPLTPIRVDPDDDPVRAAANRVSTPGPLSHSLPSFTTGLPTTGPGQQTRPPDGTWPDQGTGTTTGGRGSRRSDPGYATAPTGYLPDSQAFRAQEQGAAQAWRPPVKVLAIGGATLVIAAVAAYVLSGSGPRPAAGAHPAAPASGATPGTTTGNALGGGSVPPPPTNVTAVRAGPTSVRISWQDSVSPGQNRNIVVGRHPGGTEHIPDQSPQVITGLKPDAAYCFEVGYVYGLQGKASYSTPVCIAAVAPSAAG